ncbi:hypothetical protein B0H13DRAFT_2312806 [Mycena leptocephala]|nr:hypothetical protein B0H13DRAFT_2312806 [Mycena leptocephala]
MCGNATQLRAKVKVTKDDLNTLKLKNLDLSESLRRATLHWLLANAAEYRWSERGSLNIASSQWKEIARPEITHNTKSTTPSSYTNLVEGAPSSLAQVCRLWRHISLSTRQLWSSLDLIFLKNQSSADVWAVSKIFPYTGVSRTVGGRNNLADGTGV